MPTRTWLVDETRIELVDRGALGITLRVGDVVTPIPPRTIGAWPIALPGRRVQLEARRNLDVVRFFVFSDDHPVPRGRGDAAAIGFRCAHAGAAACPDGHHCGACLWTMFDAEHARIRRVRQRAVVGTFAALAVLLGIGVAVRAPRVVMVGAAGLVLTVVLVVGGLLAERRERLAGRGAAVDPRFAATPEARARKR